MLNYSAIQDDRVRNRAPGMSAVADYTAPPLMVPLLHSRDAATLAAELCSKPSGWSWPNALERVNDVPKSPRGTRRGD